MDGNNNIFSVCLKVLCAHALQMFIGVCHIVLGKYVSKHNNTWLHLYTHTDVENTEKFYVWKIEHATTKFKAKIESNCVYKMKNTWPLKWSRHMPGWNSMIQISYSENWIIKFQIIRGVSTTSRFLILIIWFYEKDNLRKVALKKTSESAVKELHNMM